MAILNLTGNNIEIKSALIGGLEMREEIHLFLAEGKLFLMRFP